MSASNLTKRTYVASRFAIDLGGTPGFLKSLEGGNVKAAVMTEGVGAHNTVFKSIGLPEIDDVSFQIGLSSSPQVNDWIKRSWANDYQRQDGSLYTADFNYEIKSEREFKDALITEVGFPACDASAKEPGYMSVKFRPQSIEFKKNPKGEKLRGIFSEHQKLWLPSNFRLVIADLDLKTCNKVEAMTIKQSVIKLEAGQGRVYDIEPAKLEYPNVVFTIAESHAQSVIDWHNDFVIKGNCDQGNEKKTGHLTFLSPNLKEELGEIEFKQIGILNVTPDKGEAGSESIRRVKVECYVEEMVFAPKTSFTKRF